MHTFFQVRWKRCNKHFVFSSINISTLNQIQYFVLRYYINFRNIPEFNKIKLVGIGLYKPMKFLSYLKILMFLNFKLLFLKLTWPIQNWSVLRICGYFYSGYTFFYTENTMPHSIYLHKLDYFILNIYFL